MQQFSVKRKNFGRIGVFLGGTSKERAISLKSGQAVYQALTEAGQNAILIDTANGFHPKLKDKSIDVAFIALHGAGGEDGSIQKILNRYQIPYTGAGPKGSKLAFDKELTKRRLKVHHIPTPDYVVINQRNWRKVITRWKAPYVVKPLDEGSSIGIFFVERNNSGLGKIKSAIAKYKRLLIERKIEGREFTVGILGNKALPVIELKPKRRFYDFKAKYTKGLTEYLAPAPIADDLRRKLQALAVKTHKALKLSDLSRVDFKVGSDQVPYVLEANSIPGFTETSLLPKAAQCVGMDFQELCLYLVDQASQRKRKF